MAGFILITVVTVPMGLGWTQWGDGVTGRVNLGIDLLFCVDIVKNHFTGYIDKNVNVVVFVSRVVQL